MDGNVNHTYFQTLDVDKKTGQGTPGGLRLEGPARGHAAGAGGDWLGRDVEDALIWIAKVVRDPLALGSLAALSAALVSYSKGGLPFIGQAPTSLTRVLYAYGAGAAAYFGAELLDFSQTSLAAPGFSRSNTARY